MLVAWDWKVWDVDEDGMQMDMEFIYGEQNVPNLDCVGCTVI